MSSDEGNLDEEEGEKEIKHDDSIRDTGQIPGEDEVVVDEQEDDDGLQPQDTIPREFIRNILLSEKLLNKRTYSVEQSIKPSSASTIGGSSNISGGRDLTLPSRTIKRTSAPIFNRHNSFGYVPIKPRRSLPVTTGILPQGISSTASPLHQQSTKKSEGLQVTPYPQQQYVRRESFLYRHDEDHSDSEWTAPGSGVVGSGISYPQDPDQQNLQQVVTPFAQILNSLKTIRHNYCVITNMDPGSDGKRSRRCSSSTPSTSTSLSAIPVPQSSQQQPSSTTTSIEPQTQQVSSTSTTGKLPLDTHHGLVQETLDELDWVMEQLENLHITKSIGDMTTVKFKKMLNKELSQFSESSKSGNLISNYLLSTYIDKQLPELNIVANSKTDIKPLIDNPSGSNTLEQTPYGIPLDEPNVEAINALLETPNWNLNLFQLSPLCSYKPLTCLGYHVFECRNFFKTFNIPQSTLVNYLLNLESNYHTSVPYHNNLHATDVLNSTNILLNLESFSEVFSQLEILATIFAAMIHDVDHPGVTNQFLINSDSNLALLYNDESVLENHHLSIGFKILQSPGCDILGSLTRLQRQTLRKLAIDLVLATDMSKHMILLSNLKTMVETKTITNGILCFDDYQERIQVLQTLVHCADLSNPTKELDLYKKWVELVMKEFYLQGDREKELGLEVSPMCDRNNSSIEKTQVGFITFICQPLFETWNELVQHPLTCEMLDVLEINSEYYNNLITPSPPNTAIQFKLTLDEEEDEPSSPPLTAPILEPPSHPTLLEEANP